MLLSNEIEKALYKGECVYKTFNTGYTNTFTIPIPKGSYIILRQIIYYPVLSSIELVDRTVVQLSMIEQGSTNEILYQFRNNTIFSEDRSTGAIIAAPGEPQNVETWKVFKKNAVIDICFGDKANEAGYPGALIFEESANERNPPLGYNGIPVEHTVRIGLTPPGNKLYPTGQQREFIPPGQYTGFLRDRLRYNFDLTTLIPNVDVTSSNAGHQFPLFTFGYFEFQNALSINLQ